MGSKKNVATKNKVNRRKNLSTLKILSQQRKGKINEDTIKQCRDNKLDYRDKELEKEEIVSRHK